MEELMNSLSEDEANVVQELVGSMVLDGLKQKFWSVKCTGEEEENKINKDKENIFKKSQNFCFIIIKSLNMDVQLVF